MTPINIDGEKSFVHLQSPETMYDLRREVGEAGWLTLEKAKAAAVGAKSPIFMAATPTTTACWSPSTRPA
jgi:hypothetical protein